MSQSLNRKATSLFNRHPKQAAEEQGAAVSMEAWLQDHGLKDPKLKKILDICAEEFIETPDELRLLHQKDELRDVFEKCSGLRISIEKALQADDVRAAGAGAQPPAAPLQAPVVHTEEQSMPIEQQLEGFEEMLSNMRSTVGSSREQRNFHRFQKVWRNVLPKADAALFKQAWLRKHPQQNSDGSFKYEWSSAMGDILVHGSPFEVDDVIPGSLTVPNTKSVEIIATGQKAKLCGHVDVFSQFEAGQNYRVKKAGSGGKICTHQGAELRFVAGCAGVLETSADLRAVLSPGGCIRVGGHALHVKEIRYTPTQERGQLTLQSAFPGEAGSRHFCSSCEAYA
jgi:hypothetical protein